MTLVCVAGSTLVQSSGGQPGRACDTLAAIPAPRDCHTERDHPATAHKAGESGCGDGKFLISSLHQPCQPLTFITQ